jgi:hypothetical protein
VCAGRPSQRRIRTDETHDRLIRPTRAQVKRPSELLVAQAEDDAAGQVQALPSCRVHAHVLGQSFSAIGRQEISRPSRGS